MGPRKKRIVYIIIIVLFLLMLLTVTLFIVFNNKNQQIKGNTSNPPTDTYAHVKAANNSDNIEERQNNNKKEERGYNTTKSSTQNKDSQIEGEDDDQTSNHIENTPQRDPQPDSQTETPLQPIFQGITTMQAMTPEVCASEPTPQNTITITTDTHQDGTAIAIPQTILKDTRDNKLYYIRKLADGNCWMAQNLAFFNDRIYSNNSDTTVEFSISNGWIKINGWETSPANTNLCLTESGGASTCDTPENSANLKKIGYYYNYATWNTNSTVCPKGWTIPDKTSSKGWEKVKNSYNGDIANLSSALNLIKAGYLETGYSKNIGASGRYMVRYRDGLADGNLYSFYSNTGVIGSENMFYDRKPAFWESIRCINR